jgi:hypothetical protein
VLDDMVADTEPAEEDAERLKDLASEAPVIRLVNQLIARAVETHASDVHLEPFRTGCGYAIAMTACCTKSSRRRRAFRPPSSRASRSWRGCTLPSGGGRRTAVSS